MNIEYILEIIRSKPDRAGGVYWAFVFTSTKTGKYVVAECGYGSGENARIAVYHLNGKEHKQNYRYYLTELPIRRFNRHIKGMKHVSGVEEMAKLMATVNAQHSVGDNVVLVGEGTGATYTITKVSANEKMEVVYTILPKHGDEKEVEYYRVAGGA